MFVAHQMVLQLLVACGARWIHLLAAMQSGLGQPVVATPFGVPSTSLSFDPVSFSNNHVSQGDMRPPVPLYQPL